MNWRLWGRGLLAAMISSAVNSLAVWTVDPHDFNFGDGLLNMGKVALVSALIGGVLYLKEHPDPWADIVRRHGDS